MEVSRVAEILEAQVLTCSDFLDGEVCSACGSDMMSDVLAFVKHQGLLLTGLMNPQVIRTAMMMDMDRPSGGCHQPGRLSSGTDAARRL